MNGKYGELAFSGDGEEKCQKSPFNHIYSFHYKFLG